MPNCNAETVLQASELRKSCKREGCRFEQLDISNKRYIYYVTPNHTIKKGEYHVLHRHRSSQVYFIPNYC